MRTWVKVTLGVVGLLVVLFIALVVVTAYMVRRYGPEMVDEGRRVVEEGREYGRLTDDVGCLNEAVARQARVGGFRDMIKNNVFTRACLEASRPTPGFCEGVPGRTDFMKGAAWQAERCSHYGLPPEKQCGQLMQQVQQYCEKRRAVPGVGSHEAEAGPPEPTPGRGSRAR